jgi:large subunit ribosomal protein L21
MYAVVKTGGKQLCVEKGAIEVVEKLDASVGDVVTLTPLLLSDDGTILSSAAELATVTVTAEVVEHFKAAKVMVFKFKKRKGYKKTQGHRQRQTRILITDITVGGKPKKVAAKKTDDVVAEKPAAKPKAAPKPKAEVTEKPAAKPKAAPKPAAKPKAETAEVAEKPAPKPKAAPKPKPAAKPKAAPKADAPAAAGKPAAKAPARKPAARKPAVKKEAPADSAE